MQKKIIAIVLVILILVSSLSLSVSAATFDDLNNPSVFLTQPAGSVTCTLVAAAMMMRRAAMASGNSNWAAITPDSIKSVAWSSDGLYYSFSYAGISVKHDKLPGGSNNHNFLINLLKDHPEGIEIFKKDRPTHAILLTDYTNGVFYCADPAYENTNKGRIPISKALRVTIENADDYWYVASPKVTINGYQLDLGTDFYAYIIVRESWKFLEGNTSGELTNVQLAENGNDKYDPKQIWKFIRQNDGSYEIRNMHDDSCLDACSMGTENGTNIITFEASGGQNQRWFIVDAGNELSYIKAAYCDKVLDVYDGSSAPGTNIQLYESNGTAAQKFAIRNLMSDNISYSKPEKPSAPILSVSASKEKTVFNWTASSLISSEFDKRHYDLRVYNNANGQIYETVYKIQEDSYSIDLPAGSYYAKVSAVNSKYSNWYTHSNVVYFDVAECGHTWNSGVVTTPATCTSEGVKTFTCTVCTATKTEAIAKLDHIYTTKVDAKYLISAATETSAAVYYMSCSVCGAKGTVTFTSGDPLPPAVETDTVLGVSSAKTTAGKEIILTLSLKENPGIAGLSVSLNYDETALTLKTVTNGTMFSSLTSGKNFIFDNAGNVTSDGTVATFTFTVNDNTAAGDYTVTPVVRSFVNDGGEDVPVKVEKGTVTVTDFIYGDANDDEMIDMKDVVLLRRYLAEFDYETNSSPVEIGLGADANGDDEIDMKDVVLLRRYLAEYDYETDTSSVVLGPQ